MFDLGTTAGLALGGAVLFLPAWALARRRHRVSLKAGSAPAPSSAVKKPAGTDPGSRLEAIEQMQAELAARIEALSQEGDEPKQRMQAMAAQLLEVIRDRNATFETALAGLEQLRGRMRALEDVGDLAESRSLIDALTARIDGLKSGYAADSAALEVRLTALEAPGENPFAEISDQLTRLYSQKDDGLETVLTRLAPLESKLAALESREPAAVLAERLETRIAELQKIQDETRTGLAALKAEGASAAERAARTDQEQERRDARAETRIESLAETLAGRLEAVERDLASRDPQALLEQFSRRFETLKEVHAGAEARLKERLSALENPGETPFADISDQLTRLYAQKDATVETVFARLAPLEEKLAEMERGFEARDPAPALERFAERLDAVGAAGETAELRLGGRIADISESQGQIRTDLAALRAEAGTVAAVTERLEKIHARRDTLAETIAERLTKLEQDVATRDPAKMLERFAERLEAMKEAHAGAEARLKERLSTLENPGETPFADISDQLTRLYAQKDATVETVFARLAPLEEKLAGVEQELAAHDPQAALDRFAVRLGNMKEAHAQAERGLRDRLTALENPGETPFADISDQLTRLYAQKDATVETVFARLAPLEERLAGMEENLSSLDPKADLERLGARLSPLEEGLSEVARGLEERDPKAALARFAERLEGLKTAHAASETALREMHAASEAGLRDRLAALETPGENPFAEISEQLTQLYAQKDATVETVFARLAPLEERLAGMEENLSSLDPKADLERLGARLTPLEEGLSAVARGLEERDPKAALARFAERLEGLKTAHAASETALREMHAASEAGLRDRLAALETPGENPFAEISEQLTQLYAQKDATVETVFARLAPLEERLAGMEENLSTLDPKADLERLGARLSPLEEGLSEVARGLEERDPKAALARFAERLEGLKAAHAASEAGLRDRLAALETPGENPFAEISEQLTQLYAQKDATVETVFARLAPLEERLAGMEHGLGAITPLVDAGSPERIAALNTRLDAMDWAQDEIAGRVSEVRTLAADMAPYADIADRLSELYARKEESVEAVIKQLAPIEARLARLEENPWDPEADEARAQAQAIATQMIAARAAAEHTELFANRLALLETSLPRLSAAQSVLMQTLEHRGDAKELAKQVASALVPGEAASRRKPGVADDMGKDKEAPSEPQNITGNDTADATGDDTGTGAEDESIWDMPQLVSLHRK